MSTKQPKPGVRTKLNSGENKIIKINKSGSNSKENSVPNPTAVAASQKLPKMELSTSTNWAEETSPSVLNMAIAITSERTLGENKVIVIPENAVPEVIQTETPQSATTSNKKPKVKKDTTITPKKKNKYKKQAAEKISNIIGDIKDSISLSVDSMKIDYNRLSEIQNGLKTSAKDLQTTITNKTDEIKNYTDNMKQELQEFRKETVKQKKAAKTPTPPKQQAANKPIENKTAKISTSQIDEIKKASEYAAESQANEVNTKNQKLSEAYISRDSLQKTIASLKAQLNYAKGDRKDSINERIKKKQAQLNETLALIEQILNNENNK